MTRSVSHPGIVVLAFASVFTLSAIAQQPSLGDLARQARKNKPTEPTTKVITNDDLRSGAIAPDPTTSTDESKPAAEDGKSSEPSPADKAKAEEEKAKAAKNLQDQIAAERDKITKLQSDIDNLQQQSKQRASNYYADAGTRLRDPKKYADDVQKDKDDIAAKQKELEAAQTKLEQLEDQARKAEQ
jgi:predicted RNase H-like nuclease (RuvC/YqgF family)